MQNLDFVPHYYLWHLTTSAIFILCFISAIISYFSKEKSFGYYAIYGLTLLIFLNFKSPYDFPLRDLMYESRFASLNWYVQVIYNSIYFFFFIYFLDVKKYYPKVSRLIKKVVWTIFLVSSTIFVVTLFVDQIAIFTWYFTYLFTPVMFCFALYTIGWSITIPGKLKYFIIFGGLIYISLAVFALIMTILNEGRATYIGPIFYFYLGVFIEQIAFALGLAYKVKMINKKLLFQLTENEKIKNSQNQLLESELKKKEEELLKITAKAEAERIAKIKSDFENEIYQLHLTSLQNQMNPHFIFNALNSIKVFLIDNDKEQAVYFLNKFAKLIRKILDSSRHDSISLKEELEIIKLYMGIENLRFDNTIGFEIIEQSHVNIDGIKIPPLFFQPFVENALWHGLMLSKNEKKISIKIYNEQGLPMLSIIDNGIGREKSSEHRSRKVFQKESLGLKMTRERMEYFNQREGCNYEFEIIDLKDENGNPRGTEIRFIFK